jgi:hypothetical protein
MFERAKPRGQISARELREAGQILDAVRPAVPTGGSVAPVSGPGGTAWVDDAGAEFLAEVTHVVTGSPGDPDQYGFLEKWQVPASGALETRPSGRKSDGTKNWALAVPNTTTFVVGDLVRVRRHPRNPNLFEAVKWGGGASITPNSDDFTFTERSYSCASGSLVETATTYTVTVAIAADGTITITKV